jgi:hypothetical protein
VQQITTARVDAYVRNPPAVLIECHNITGPRIAPPATPIGLCGRSPRHPYAALRHDTLHVGVTIEAVAERRSAQDVGDAQIPPAHSTNAVARSPRPSFRSNQEPRGRHPGKCQPQAFKEPPPG